MLLAKRLCPTFLVQHFTNVYPMTIYHKLTVYYTYIRWRWSLSGWKDRLHCERSRVQPSSRPNILVIFGEGQNVSFSLLCESSKQRHRHSNYIFILTPKALNYFVYTMETKGFCQYEIIINVLVSSFRFI